MKISTKNIGGLPSIENLKKLCKGLATLDAIISREWEFRYFSYDKNWDKDAEEEYFSMRDGSGDTFQILFSRFGCVINGFAHESEMNKWEERVIEPSNLIEKLKSIFSKKQSEQEQIIWEGLLDKLPNEFHNFIYGEPIKSLGTTFCIWRRNQDEKWNIGDIKFPNDKYGDGSQDLIYILDNEPKTYQKWAIEYYDETFEENKLKIQDVKSIYSGEILTDKLLKSINPNIEEDELEELRNELTNEIGYEQINF
jgi:hypothetical protein